MSAPDSASTIASTGPPSTDAVLDTLEMLRPISLAELNDRARLMTRVDRKYFVPRDVFIDLVRRTRNDFAVLEIDGRRHFRYRTTYFDTPEFALFRQHVQGRRNRYKVRVRTYCESGDRLVEVKSKGYRGQTIKTRTTYDGPDTRLDQDALEFVEGAIGNAAELLVPVLDTVYERITFVRGEQRLTCDLNLQFLAGRERHEGPNDVLVETKSGGERGIWDELLATAGIREHPVSKYCTAASLLYPGLPSNRWRRTIRRYFATR